mgnify:CR=1 FL=1
MGTRCFINPLSYTPRETGRFFQHFLFAFTLSHTPWYTYIYTSPFLLTRSLDKLVAGLLSRRNAHPWYGLIPSVHGTRARWKQLRSLSEFRHSWGSAPWAKVSYSETCFPSLGVNYHCYWIFFCFVTFLYKHSTITILIRILCKETNHHKLKTGRQLKTISSY